ncbi:hypothetical protein LCL89_09325 [Halobacillus yeomjeoni]|uniref:hypothetical protein n=1 Tax=Halobacillus yeomjeoni TaxID=311194 RepID=UPI001CD5527E|nr:hypothetical protein [Halobacillus yeomjeoni]MCA0984244.1 hypothetical protein [Halobacillus yeomjeoni]
MGILVLFLIIAVFSTIVYSAYKHSVYQKGNIVFHLDEWYKDYNKYVKAIEVELKNRGREANYLGSFHFEIDGKLYVFHPQIVTQARVPTQRTILIPKK